VLVVIPKRVSSGLARALNRSVSPALIDRGDHRVVSSSRVIVYRIVVDAPGETKELL
jgi:hypothetical protein